MKKSILWIVLLLITFEVFGQEVKTGTIITFGKEQNIRFIEKDGTFYVNWQDLSAAVPNWFVINSEGKIEMSIELMTMLLNGISNSYSESSSDVIETRIDGEFEGWDGETIFKMQNGQIWQQDEYAYTYTYKYSPKVTIIRSSGSWKMQVEGMSKAIRVKKIR
jgi:hypothetical protein